MNQFEKTQGRPRRIIAAAVLVLVSLVLWAVLHPDFRPDLNLVSEPVRKGISKAGFQATKGVKSARFESEDSELGFKEVWDEGQKIVAIDASLTEKRTRRKTRALSQQTTGLYVGPIAVVRFSRNWPPIIGDLLPYHFWTSSRLTKFVVDETVNFPKELGGKLVARMTYEDRNADGALAQTEHRNLRCEVKSAVNAASLDSRLSGQAIRIECEESLAPDGPVIGGGSPLAYAVGKSRFAHWYIVDRAWSIPIEGESEVFVGDRSSTRKWSSKLLDFELMPQG